MGTGDRTGISGGKYGNWYRKALFVMVRTLLKKNYNGEITGFLQNTIPGLKQPRVI